MNSPGAGERVTVQGDDAVKSSDTVVVIAGEVQRHGFTCELACSYWVEGNSLQ